MANSNAAPRWLVLGSGVKGPMEIVTSGQYLGRNSAGCTFTVLWNLDGTAGSYNPYTTNAGWITGQVLPAIVGGTRTPLMGGSPAGTFVVEGAGADGAWYTDLGVTVSSLFGVASSGLRLVSIAGAMPDWIRLRYRNTASSGVFNIGFSSHGLGSGIG